MRAYAQFFHNSTGWNGTDFSGPVRLIEACGDRSVIILDGRMNDQSMIMIAQQECVKRGYLAFQVRRGPRFDCFLNYTSITRIRSDNAED